MVTPVLLALLAAAAAADDGFDSVIAKHASERGVNPRLVKAIISVESGFSPQAVSPAGARGLMQLMPATAAEVGVPAEKLFEPDSNIKAGVAYLAALCGVFRRVHGFGGVCRGDGPAWGVSRVLAAYHAGPSVLQGRAWHPSTRAYVAAVLKAYRSEASVLRPVVVARVPSPEGA